MVNEKSSLVWVGPRAQTAAGRCSARWARTSWASGLVRHLVLFVISVALSPKCSPGAAMGERASVHSPQPVVPNPTRIHAANVCRWCPPSRSLAPGVAGRGRAQVAEGGQPRADELASRGRATPSTCGEAGLSGTRPTWAGSKAETQRFFQAAAGLAATERRCVAGSPCAASDAAYHSVPYYRCN